MSEQSGKGPELPRFPQILGRGRLERHEHYAFALEEFDQAQEKMVASSREGSKEEILPRNEVVRI